MPPPASFKFPHDRKPYVILSSEEKDDEGSATDMVPLDEVEEERRLSRTQLVLLTCSAGGYVSKRVMLRQILMDQDSR
jgi:hypothetical protein